MDFLRTRADLIVRKVKTIICNNRCRLVGGKCGVAAKSDSTIAAASPGIARFAPTGITTWIHSQGFRTDEQQQTYPESNEPHPALSTTNCRLVVCSLLPHSAVLTSRTIR